MKICSVIILLVVSLCAKAQDIAEVVRLRAAGITIVSNDSLEYIAKDNARHVLIAFNEDDPKDLQNVIDNFDSGWFVDLDVFIGDDVDSVFEFIQSTPHAAFLEHKGNVLIDVSETHDLCLVTIYCLNDGK